MNIINVGVIGCGYWGPHHVRIFNSLPQTRVVTVAERDSSRWARITGSWPSVKCVTEATEVLADPSIGAVVIVTPTATHFELVKAALLAGKHVFCEKPLCLTKAEAEELQALSVKTGKVLMVGHVFLFNPGLRRIKDLLDRGELGDVRYLSAVRTNLGPIRSDVNASYDLASHDIAIFNWLMNAEPVEVQAMGASFLHKGVEDVVQISLRYPSGALGTIQSSWLDPKKVRSLTLVGSKQMATWDDLALSTPVSVYEKGVEVHKEVTDFGEFLRHTMWEGDVRLLKVANEEPLKAQANAFVDAMNKGKAEISGAEFATGVVAVLEVVEKCLKQVAK